MTASSSLTIFTVTSQGLVQAVAALMQAKVKNGALPADYLLVNTTDSPYPAASERGLRELHLPGWTRSAAITQALELSPAGAVYVDPEAVLQTEGWLHLLQAKAAASGAAAIGCQTLDTSGLILSCGRNLTTRLGIREHHANIGWNDYDFGQFDRMGPVDSLAGSLIFFTSKALVSGALLDKNLSPKTAVLPRAFPRWLEFDDYCMQLLSRSLTCEVEPAVKCIWLGGLEKTHELSPDILSTRARYYAYWRKKWGWDPEFPCHHHIRAKWGHTPICRAFADRLLQPLDDEPLVDILLPTWNNTAYLSRCLDSLAQSEYRAIRLYILDNGSVDDTADYLSRLQKDYPFPIEVARPPVNIGVPAAMNWLAHISTAPLLLRLDEDIRLPKNWLRPMIELLRANPYAGAVGPKFIADDASRKVVCSEFRLWPDRGPHFGEDDGPAHSRTTFVNVHFGGCLLYRRRVFEIAGNFDMRLSVISWEDLEHLMRARAAGFDVIYDGSLEVEHPLKALREVRPIHQANCRANGIKVISLWGSDSFEILERMIDQSALTIPTR